LWELFTSEGCSSCPPADDLLSRNGAATAIANVEVIALEEHVDYWNELGWVDPFSSREWTARQQVYAEVLGNRNAYTPQMVVDGKTEFVGSQSRKAWQAVQQAAAEQRGSGNAPAGKIAGFRNRKLVREHYQVAGDGRP